MLLLLLVRLAHIRVVFVLGLQGRFVLVELEQDALFPAVYEQASQTPVHFLVLLLLLHLLDCHVRFGELVLAQLGLAFRKFVLLHSDHQLLRQLSDLRISKFHVDNLN